MSEKKTCCARVYRKGWNRYGTCYSSGKVERDGKWYCLTHAPERVAARRAAQEDRLDRLHEERRLMFAVASGERAVIEAAEWWRRNGSDADLEIALDNLKGAREALRKFKVEAAEKVQP